MFLFWNVAESHGIDEHAHFQDFPTAVVTLTRTSTSEAWNMLLLACRTGTCRLETRQTGCGGKVIAELYARRAHVCAHSMQGFGSKVLVQRFWFQGFGSKVLVPRYFYSFLVLSSLLLINLFVCIILDQLSSLQVRRRAGHVTSMH